MKYSTLTVLGLSVAFSGALIVDSAPIVSAAETAERTAIPATLEELWQAIDVKSADLKRTIDKGRLGEVHHQAFAIRDLVAGLPSRSNVLSAEKLAKVKAGVKFVATLAERLDATGDADDAAGTKQNFEKLSTVLSSLRADYPVAKQVP